MNIKNIIISITISIVIIVIVGLIINCLPSEYSNKITAFSSIILMFITGAYAISTHEMAETMKKQAVPDIKLFDKRLISRLPDDPYPNFELSFTARNKNGGAGSIDDPILILKVATVIK